MLIPSKSSQQVSIDLRGKSIVTPEQFIERSSRSQRFGHRRP